jgi:hypothetical protein
MLETTDERRRDEFRVSIELNGFQPRHQLREETVHLHARQRRTTWCCESSIWISVRSRIPASPAEFIEDYFHVSRSVSVIADYPMSTFR